MKEESQCTELRSYVKVEVGVLCSPSLTVRIAVSVALKATFKEEDDDDEVMLNVLRCQLTY